MASTVVQIDIPEVYAPVLVLLAPAESGLVAANPAGYVVSLGAHEWQYSITVPEACVGIYRVTVLDGDGVAVAQGWVWIEADDTRPYIADGSASAVFAARDAVTKVSTALAAYDGPTKAEMDSGLSGVQSAVIAAGLKQVDVRSAVGMAAADLDAQLTAAIAAATTAANQTTLAALKAGTRAGLGGRWRNLATGADSDDISVEDI